MSESTPETPSRAKTKTRPFEAGDFVVQVDTDGAPVRYGLVVDPGRDPRKALKGETANGDERVVDESHEPLVAWLAASPIDAAAIVKVS